MDLITITGGIVAALAGVACLYLSWRGVLRKGGWPVPLGWALIGLSIYLWVRAQGGEFGTAFALLVMPLFAWAVIGFAVELRSAARRTRDPEPATNGPGGHRWAYHAGMLLLTVLLSGAAALLGASALGGLLPWEPVDAMVFAAYLMPVLWGVAAFWVSADPKVYRPVVVLAVLILSSSAYLFL